MIVFDINQILANLRSNDGSNKFPINSSFTNVLNKNRLHNSSVLTIAISLAACNNSSIDVTPTTPCDNSLGVICLDDELLNASTNILESSIQLPSDQTPVSGTTGSDSFIASSEYLTSKAIIDGGAGQDTLNLNLQSSIKSSPQISNIENFSLTSLGDYSLDLSNVSDLDYILSENSLGKITISGLTEPSTVFGFSGNGINSTILTDNELGGSADVLKLKLISAENVNFQSPIGYERLEVEVSGNSSLNFLLASGVTTAIIDGDGDLTLGSDFTRLNSFSSSQLNGKIIGNNFDYEGFSKTGIIGSNLGTAVELGDGSDNLYFLDKADGNSLNTIILGSGDDKIAYEVGSNSQNSIFGNSGNDIIKLLGEKTTLNEVIDGGLGADTVSIEQNSNNALNLSNIETLILKN